MLPDFNKISIYSPRATDILGKPAQDLWRYYLFFAESLKKLQINPKSSPYHQANTKG